MPAAAQGGSLDWFRSEVQAIRDRADWAIFALLGTAAITTIVLFGAAAFVQSARSVLLWPLAASLVLCVGAVCWTRRTRRIRVGVTLLASMMLVGIAGVITVQRGSHAPALVYGLTTVAVVFIAGHARLGMVLGLSLTAWTSAVTWAVQTGRLTFSATNPLGEANARLLAFVLALVLIGVAARIVQRRRDALDLLLERAIRLTEAERDEAQALADRRARAVTDIGHEIRTPMTGIVGAAQLLSSHPLPPVARQLLSIQRQSAERLILLVNAVLDRAKIDALSSDVVAAPYTPRQIAAEVTELFAPAAHRKGIEIFWTADTRLPVTVSGDAMRVRQIVSNLVSNAVKFTPSGTLHVQLVRVADDRMRFDVRDTGRGISPDRLATVFDRFVSESAPDTGHEGTGLGLPISRDFARAMGGDVTASSEPGRGSCFMLELPCVPTETEHRPTALAQPVLAGCVWVVGASAPLEAQLRPMLGELKLAARFVDAPPDAASWAQGADTGQVLLVDGWAGHGRCVDRLPELLEWTQRQRGRLVVVNSVAQDAALGALDDVWQIFRPPNLETLREALSWALDASARQAPVPVNGSSRRRILLADDNPVNQIIGRSMLENMNFEVTVVHDGQTALTACSNSGFDLVLMDLQMPGMGGLDATRRLRVAEYARGQKRVAVVAVTGQLADDIEQECLDAGIDEVLPKPYTIEQLRRVVEAHLLPPAG